MSPKTLGDERQKMTKACDSCKRSKQKCKGIEQGGAFVGRETRCAYIANGPRGATASPVFGPPLKRCQVEISSQTPGHEKTTASKRIKKQKEEKAQIPKGIDLFQQARTLEHDEEADVHGQTRMLQDRTGRLLYFGDSAACSYLQLIRMIVEDSVGPSQFTKDPDRHKTSEVALTKLNIIGTSHMLPEKKVAGVLMQFFYANTQGFVEVIDRRELQQKLNCCYANPLTASPPDLCLIYLVLSIGLATAAPTRDSPDYDIVARIHNQRADQAEIFFQNAKNLGDALSGFEDGDVWSIQALCLMSVYTLVVSKRNAAYAFLGMAIRSAYSLGLHKTPETETIFKYEDLAQRRNIWRTLFVLDRFLALSLGRPSSISDEDCSGDSLEAPHAILSNSKGLRQEQTICLNGLDAGVQASRTIGLILKRIYSKGKISTREAQDIVSHCQDWASNLDATLDAKRLHDPNVIGTYGMAILQVQLLGHHSIILLARPFFQFQLMKVRNSQQPFIGQNSAMEKFSEACLDSSIQTIKLCHIVFESGRLPRRNPFVIYFLYFAVLIVLSNEFACLHSNIDYPDLISNAMKIISHCATVDIQAKHFYSILLLFQDVIQNQTRHRASTTPVKSHNSGYTEDTSTNSSQDSPSSLSPSRVSSGKGELKWPPSDGSTPSKSHTVERRAPRVTHNPWEQMSVGLSMQRSEIQIQRASLENERYSSTLVIDFSGPQEQGHGTPESGQSDHEFSFGHPWSLGTTSRTPSSAQNTTPMYQDEVGEVGTGLGNQLVSGIPGMPRDQPCGAVNPADPVMISFPVISYCKFD